MAWTFSDDVLAENPGLAQALTQGRKKQRSPSSSVTPLQAAFETLYRQLGGVGEWEYNYRFLPGRRYELDYALPAIRVGVEVNGGQWMKSGHSSGRGLHRDADKQNHAVAAGWAVFWLTTDMLQPGSDPAHVERIVSYVKERLHDLE